MRRYLVILSLIVLAACEPARPYSATNPHTLVARHVSQPVVRVIDLTSSVEIAAVALIGGDREVWAIKTFVTRTDLNYPRIGSVWSFGRRLDYTRDDRRRAGRSRQEAGHIRLSRREFEVAADRGLVFRMIGARGSYDVTAPQRIFRQVLDRAG